MKSALFSLFEEKFSPVWRFWELWRSKLRFGQKVLRMSWKERFVQFLWKAHCFPVLARISGQCEDFENLQGQKCDLAKTCCAWPKKSVLHNFHGKRSFVSFTILRTLTEKSAISKWPVLICPVFPFWREKRAAHAKTCCACPEKSVLYNFYGKRTVFPFWREFQATVRILRTFMVKNVIWPKRAPHDLKRAFCTIFMENFKENLRPVSRFWELWRRIFKRFWERFGQNVLRMSWKERFVQFLWKAHCFPENVLRRPRKSVTILRTFTVKSAIWPKRAAHVLKRAFCTIFMESALFSRFEEKFRPVWRFWELWRSKLRFGQNVLRMDDLKRAFCTIFMESALFSRFGENFCDDFECDLAKTCCACPEKSVRYNFDGKRSVFPFWREF